MRSSEFPGPVPGTADTVVNKSDGVFLTEHFLTTHHTSDEYITCNVVLRLKRNHNVGYYYFSNFPDGEIEA